MESPSKDILLAEQPVWEVEMVDGEQQCPTVTSFSPATSVEEAEDITRSQDEGEEEFRTITVTAPVDDDVDKTDEDHVMSQCSSSLQASIPEKGKLFDPRSLQIPEQQNAVEGSQVGGKTMAGILLNFSLNWLFYLLSLVNYHHWCQLWSTGIRGCPS